MPIKDSDASKLAGGTGADDSMFETLPEGWNDAWDILSGQSDNWSLDQEAPATETPNAEAEALAAETEADMAGAPAEETPAETTTEDAPAEETPADAPAEGDDEKAMQEIASALWLSSEQLMAAWEELQAAVESGNSEELKKKLAAFELAQKDMEYNNSLLQQQLDNERENSKRYLDEKRQAELDSREKSKIYDTIMDSEGLKNLVMYKQYSETNPDYVDKYKQTLKEFFEQEYGVSLDSLVSQGKIAEKSAMDTWSQSFLWQPQWTDLINGMFEEL